MRHRPVWSVLVLAVIGLLAAPPVARADGVFDRVPEAADYQLVYDLDIPVGAAFNTTGVPYAVDNSGSYEDPFDRVAYYLELTTGSDEVQWVYTSVRAYTSDPTLIGVPAAGSGAFFQRQLEDLNVRSNVGQVATGDGLAGGNLEFWPSNYGAPNVALVPGASDDVYDFGDTPSASGDYGSMQIHLHSRAQTLFAYNRWGAAAGGAADIGIGNNQTPTNEGVLHTDWTFRGNARLYTSRRLQVLVRPGPTPLELLASAPLPFAVYQRDDTGVGDVPIRIANVADAVRAEARAQVVDGFSGAPADWRVIVYEPVDGVLEGTLPLLGGWYEIGVRTIDGDGGTVSATIGPVGVGEVLITAGQSNSANSGNPRLVPTDPRVTAYGPGGWRPAADPQPIATGGGGSPWPHLGDLIAERHDVPVGFISVGWGGTRVDQWLPGLSLYPRLQDALKVVGPDGARAVLWHQGESDSGAGTSADDYAVRLTKVIAESRLDAGYDVTWGVALVSYGPGFAPDKMAPIVEGQRAVIAADPLVFEGPITDDLTGSDWRHDGIHFNEAGLREHARRWAERIAIPTARPTATPAPTPTLEPENPTLYLPQVQG